MHALKLSQLLKLFTRHNQMADAADFRLNIICDKSVITTLRKRLFWEMHDLGLRASQVTIAPENVDSHCKLSVVLNCPLQQRQILDDMALRLSQLPEIHRVHWGRRAQAARPQSRGLFGHGRARAA
ncbi:hypothetical protein DK842_00410 [Chromobacterium phragmitis]|uniref:ACT domain-containing protein n=1 Tax=Chromobacterium phragmitis TaxID=2202141 RepID=A0A344UEZ9_9NEIS|nr:hypothetical protein [Chromobacterium phragmitis]AXE28521.1 hypothetical protein DK842_00410 [Chromobacterium phragmitis]AXE33847.1 hypothetical protein DK843_05690 [Chromobacterium phragmitis]